jgi:hypothetical protein
VYEHNAASLEVQASIALLQEKLEYALPFDTTSSVKHYGGKRVLLVLRPPGWAIFTMGFAEEYICRKAIKLAASVAPELEIRISVRWDT